MNGTNALLFEYGKQHHPLAAGLEIDEAVLLVDRLRNRLGSSTRELDLSPASLRRLERNLIEWHQSLQQQNKILKDEEVLQLVREIAAYFGLVLIHHAEGKWETQGTLWHTEIQFEGPIKVVKGSHSRISQYPLVLLIGNRAAGAWDMVIKGEPLKLYQSFRRAKRKLAKGI